MLDSTDATYLPEEFMKLERMNDQQIKCTLTGEDLRERKIKLTELAYGSEKARSLFREMLLQAYTELNFEVEGEPLMIEAVPMGADSMVLIITKVDDPDELDTRFARFAPDVLDDNYLGSEDDGELAGSAEDIQTWLAKDASDRKVAAPSENKPDLNRLFSLRSIDRCIELAKVLGSEYDGENSLYRDGRSNTYLLLLGQSGMSLTDFNRICNIVSEYGRSEKNLIARGSHLEEHYECIIAHNAIQHLREL